MDNQSLGSIWIIAGAALGFAAARRRKFNGFYGVVAGAFLAPAWHASCSCSWRDDEEMSAVRRMGERSQGSLSEPELWTESPIPPSPEWTIATEQSA